MCVCSGICAELASYEREEREVVCFYNFPPSVGDDVAMVSICSVFSAQMLHATRGNVTRSHSYSYLFLLMECNR